MQTHVDAAPTPLPLTPGTVLTVPGTIQGEPLGRLLVLQAGQATHERRTLVLPIDEGGQLRSVCHRGGAAVGAVLSVAYAPRTAVVERIGTVVAQVSFWSQPVRTHPAGLSKPRATDCVWRHVVLPDATPLEGYELMLGSSEPGVGDIDGRSIADVVPAAGLSAAPGADGLSKGELAAFVVLSFGDDHPTKEQVLRSVQALQGRPYVPTSNGSYFRAGRTDGTSWVDKGLIVPVGKQGRSAVYALGSSGPAAAMRAVQLLGRDPGPWAVVR